MRDYAKISPQLWIGETGKALRGHPEAQVLAAYLLSCPHANMIGLFYLPISFVAHETGMTLQGASKALRRVVEAGFCAYDEAAEVVWVYEMARFQIADSLKPADNRCAGIAKEYENVTQNKHLREFFERYKDAFHLTKCRGNEGQNTSPLEAPPKPLRSQEQEQEQEQEQPTLVDLAPIPKPEKREAKAERREAAKRVLQFLNERTNRAFPAVDSNLDRIAGRMAEGFSEAQCRQVIVRKCRSWMHDDKMREYLRPMTLFGKEKFSQYVGELVIDKEAK